MEGKHYLLHEVSAEDSMMKLGNAVGADFSSGELLIRPENGTGLIRNIAVETDLQLLAFDFQLRESFEFRKIALPAQGDILFHVFFILHPGKLVVRKDAEGMPFRLQKRMNVLLFSNTINVTIEVPPEKHFQAIYFTITPALLERITEKTVDGPFLLAQQLLADQKPVIFSETTDPAGYRNLHELHLSSTSQTPDRKDVVLKMQKLLSAFVPKLFSKTLHELQSSKFFYYEKMTEVEKILHSHILGQLPPIELIAKDAFMSISTLKRHFRLIYGKSIYEYYLGLKMAYARNLIETTTLSVNEVAGRLGYLKVSNFIEIFRRFHGISPGAMKRADGKKEE